MSIDSCSGTEWDACSVPPDELTPATYRHALSHFASGVVVVTATHLEEPVGMTFQSFFSVSLKPPLIAVSPACTSTTWPRIQEAGSFCVNVLSREQTELCQTFGARNDHRFDEVTWTPAPRSGAPRLEGCIAWLDCEIESAYQAGDHHLVVAAVRDLGTSGPAEPLIVYRRALGSFTHKPGLTN